MPPKRNLIFSLIAAALVGLMLVIVSGDNGLMDLFALRIERDRIVADNEKTFNDVVNKVVLRTSATYAIDGELWSLPEPTEIQITNGPVLTFIKPPALTQRLMPTTSRMDAPHPGQWLQ